VSCAAVAVTAVAAAAVTSIVWEDNDDSNSRAAAARTVAISQWGWRGIMALKVFSFQRSFLLTKVELRFNN
jgi:hypothetical protein